MCNEAALRGALIGPTIYWVRLKLLPFVVVVLLAGACSGADDLDLDLTAGTDTTRALDGMGEGIDHQDTYECGTTLTTPEFWDTVSGADALVPLAEAAGIAVGVPAEWDELTLGDPDRRVFVAAGGLTRVHTTDSPQDSDGVFITPPDADVHWVRAFDTSGAVVFDGACTPENMAVADYQPTVVDRCSVTEPLSPIGGHTLDWSGQMGRGGLVEVRRNGEVDGVFLSGEVAPDPALRIRRIEHGEIESSELEPTELNVSGSIIYSDYEAPTGIPQTYQLVARDPDGLITSSAECGTVTVPIEYQPSKCSVVADPYPKVSIELGGPLIVQLYRNGEEVSFSPNISGPAPDIDAPAGVPLTYTMRVSTLRETELVDEVVCGTVTVSTDISVIQQLELVEEAVTPGPHRYVTIRPICAGCSGEVSMYWTFVSEGPDGFELAGYWVNGEETVPADDVWEISPIGLPTMLIEAFSEGRDVQVDINDDGSGFDRWTIDGNGAEVVCEDADTAPLELRMSPFCSPD